MDAADIASLAARFNAIYTGVLTDALDNRGYMNQTLDGGIVPLRPGMRLAGPAFTIEGRPRSGHDYDTAIRKFLVALGDVPAGHVAVYQTNQTGVAHLGELSVAALKARGAAGSVLDGGCRDIEYCLREEFPIFAREITPTDSVPRWEVTATNEPTVVGGVSVRPGDWVVADLDGIVVVPAEVAEETLLEAEKKVATEDRIRDAIRAGTLPLEAYERFGTF
jgi:4-hydroxy-4-methyl-2-oxoglutarate aldolase